MSDEEKPIPRPIIVQIFLSGFFITLVALVSFIAGGIIMAGSYEDKIKSGVISVGNSVYRTERIFLP